MTRGNIYFSAYLGSSDTKEENSNGYPYIFKVHEFDQAILYIV